MLRANLWHQRHFTSDTTDYLNELKHKDPTMEARQRAGRGRLWDVTLDPDLEAQFLRGKVAQGEYVYYRFGDMSDVKPHNWFLKAKGAESDQ